MDSGATKTVCGEKSWKKILEYLSLRSIEPHIIKETRDFRFGDGAMVRSLFVAHIQVCVGKGRRELFIHILPGHTPLLLARPDLEAWDVSVKYGSKRVFVGDVEVTPAFTNNGHYMLNIFDDLEDVLHLESLQDKETEQDAYIESIYTDDVSDFEPDLDVDMTLDEAEEIAFTAIDKCEKYERKFKFWEVYVDEGNLGKYLREHYHDVEVRQFGLPNWNFEMPEQKKYFHEQVLQEEPHHIMVTPECKLWSPMQNMNYRTPQRQGLLADLRLCEEDTHLTFYRDIHVNGKRLCYDTTFEQPADAMSWKTETVSRMKGYFETVLDRCRTKLKANPSDELFVKKPTRFRSSSKRVAEAVNLRCQCQKGHVQMMGRGPALKRMQNYEPELRARLANGIYSAMEICWKKRGQAELMTLDMVERSNAETQYYEQNKDLVKIGGLEALKSVAMLHKQLGHPSGVKLVNAVKERDLPPEYPQVARKYKCPTCMKKQEPKKVRVANLHKAPHFNHTVAMDTFFMEWNGKKKAYDGRVLQV